MREKVLFLSLCTLAGVYERPFDYVGLRYCYVIHMTSNTRPSPFSVCLACEARLLTQLTYLTLQLSSSAFWKGIINITIFSSPYLCRGKG